MTNYILTLIDATDIQEYIFDSNNLAQNIGASEIVARSTTEWVVHALDAVDALKGKHNAIWEVTPERKEGHLVLRDRSIDSPDTRAEVIYAGGGNALVLFADDGERRDFTNQLTFRTLRDAPGLQLVVKSQKFNWSAKGGLSAALVSLRATQTTVPASLSVLGLSVTAACDFTALPVYDLDSDNRPVSRPVRAKLNFTPKAQERLHEELPSVRQSRYEFIYDFDQFGTHGESSYIAIIHADGNRMGERFGRITNNDNAACALELRHLSESIQAAANSALQHTVNTLIAAYKSSVLAKSVPAPLHPSKQGWSLLPFRPIVFGGDDVTFVADGRLGLSLAATYLNALRNHAPELTDKKRMYSRAGVAIVKTHYPFSRGYDLSEELAKSAKGALRHVDDTTLDWHIFTSGAVLELDEIRLRAYTDREGRSLLTRPLHIQGSWPNWAGFAKVTGEFKNGEAWKGRRNKVKALRDALRAGEAAVERFRSNHEIDELPKIDGLKDISLRGWQKIDQQAEAEAHCGYFDSIEATDFFIQLEGGQG